MALSSRPKGEILQAPVVSISGFPNATVSQEAITAYAIDAKTQLQSGYQFGPSSQSKIQMRLGVVRNQVMSNEVARKESKKIQVM